MAILNIVVNHDLSTRPHMAPLRPSKVGFLPSFRTSTDTFQAPSFDFNVSLSCAQLECSAGPAAHWARLQCYAGFSNTDANMSLRMKISISPPRNVL